MINWKDPEKELPKAGDIIAVLTYHWKAYWPQSSCIFFGEVVQGKLTLYVINRDCYGQGISSWDFNENDRSKDEYIFSWAYAEEFNMPEKLEEKFFDKNRFLTIEKWEKND